MICVKCGAIVPDGAVFCNHCGSAMENSMEFNQSQPMGDMAAQPRKDVADSSQSVMTNGTGLHIKGMEPQEQSTAGLHIKSPEPETPGSTGLHLREQSLEPEQMDFSARVQNPEPVNPMYNYTPAAPAFVPISGQTYKPLNAEDRAQTIDEFYRKYCPEKTKTMIKTSSWILIILGVVELILAFLIFRNPSFGSRTIGGETFMYSETLLFLIGAGFFAAGVIILKFYSRTAAVAVACLVAYTIVRTYMVLGRVRPSWLLLLAAAYACMGTFRLHQEYNYHVS